MKKILLASLLLTSMSFAGSVALRAGVTVDGTPNKTSISIDSDYTLTDLPITYNTAFAVAFGGGLDVELKPKENQPRQIYVGTYAVPLIKYYYNNLTINTGIKLGLGLNINSKKPSSGTYNFTIPIQLVTGVDYSIFTSQLRIGTKLVKEESKFSPKYYMGLSLGVTFDLADYNLNY